MQIDGIKGESADSGHQGWIELTSAHWGVTQPRSSSVSTAGGHTVGHLENVMLSHMDQVMREGGGIVLDEIGLCFSKVKWSSESGRPCVTGNSGSETSALPMGSSPSTPLTGRALRWTFALCGKTI
ncbi:type VI secretion system tube protein Hcp [Massilia aerilata]|uniref:Type VI secretion system tube protein Hcp n=1 Tax=Massilia aerilata TaxID=453817 RepID=A0ABW0RXN3_9BURK